MNRPVSIQQPSTGTSPSEPLSATLITVPTFWRAVLCGVIVLIAVIVHPAQAATPPRPVYPQPDATGIPRTFKLTWTASVRLTHAKVIRERTGAVVDERYDALTPELSVGRDQPLPACEWFTVRLVNKTAAHETTVFRFQTGGCPKPPVEGIPPVFTTHPDGGEFCEAEPVRLAVELGTPAGLQWLQDGVAIPGATSSVHEVPPGVSGTFVCRAVSGPFSAESTPAVVNRIILAPATLSDPSVDPQSGTLRLQTDTEARSYVWWLDGRMVEGESGPVLELTQWPTHPTTAMVIAVTSCGETSSRQVNIEPMPVPPPVWVVQPEGGVFCAEDTVSLRAEVNAGATFQWLRDGVPILGATSPGYDVPAHAIGKFACQATVGTKSTVSAVAEIARAPIPRVVVGEPVQEAATGSLRFQAVSESEVDHFLWIVDGRPIEAKGPDLELTTWSPETTVSVAVVTRCGVARSEEWTANSLAEIPVKPTGPRVPASILGVYPMEGRVRIEILRGSAGSLQIEKSHDLLHWIAVGRIPESDTEFVELEDAEDGEMGFYRIVTP